MPVPKGYKRGSGGFLQPIGRTVKSGGVGPSRSQIETQSKAKYDVIMDRISRGYEKRQKDHEEIMAGYAKAENDKWDRIQKALEAERKNAPKDKLGNPVETDLAKYLADQLKGLLINKSLKSKKLTPPEAGIPAKQIGPEGRLVTPTPGQEALQTGPAPAPTTAELKPAFHTPIPGRKMVHPMGEVILTGKTRTGKNGQQEVEATMGNKTGWVPMKDLSPMEPAETDAGAGLRQFLKDPVEDFQPF
jgi:hypothetical protein